MCVPMGLLWGVCGCYPCYLFGQYFDTLEIEGVVVDADTGEPLEGIAAGALTVIDGEISRLRPPPSTFDPEDPQVTDAEGRFVVRFVSGFVLCSTLFGPVIPESERRIPIPDDVEVQLQRPDCQATTQVTIRVNTEAEIVPGELGNRLILKDPIPLRECAENGRERPAPTEP